MPIKMVVFDCDGVLFDSQAANAAFYSSIAADLGRGPLTPEEEKYVHVHTVFESMAHVFGGDEALIEQAHRIRREKGYGPFIKLMVPEPGIYDCLDRLRPDYGLAVFTNRSETIGPVLDQHRLAPYFDMVVSCLDVDRAKPDPEGLIKIMTSLDRKPGETVYIGDSPSDAQAAEAAGTHFIAYKAALGPWPRIDHFDTLDDRLKTY